VVVSWWLLWFVFMFFLFISPVSYGWGYRGWGPPYPSYIQRQRHLRSSAAGTAGDFDHYAWGWGGDILWIILFVGVIWVFTALWWPYGVR